MQSGYQTLALDIMQRMTLLQESALERLYRWTQTQCKNIENERLAPLLIKAMNKLQDRPVLFKYELFKTPVTSFLNCHIFISLINGHVCLLFFQIHSR